MWIHFGVRRCYFSSETGTSSRSGLLCRCEIFPGFQKSHLKNQPIKLNSRVKKVWFFFLTNYSPRGPQLQKSSVRVWPNPYQNPTKKVTVSFFEQLRCVQKIQAPSPDIQMTSGLFYSKSMYQETCGKLFCGHEINGERPQQTGIFFRYHFSRICCTHLPAEGDIQ